jgi:hypothetical protein
MKLLLTLLTGQAFQSKRRSSPAGRTARRARPGVEALERRETPGALLSYAWLRQIAPDHYFPPMAPMLGDYRPTGTVVVH